MAKAVADVNGQSNQGGFATDGSQITGFSSMHDSGTGGNPSLGNFPMFPYSSCRNDDINQCTFPKKARATSYVNESLRTSPGYFGLALQSGVFVEMTVSQHTSISRVHFQRGDANGNNGTYPLILIDLTDLSDSRQNNGTIAVDSTSGTITGNARFLPSFGSGNYVLYFCTSFEGAAIHDSGIFVDSRASTDVHELTVSRGINGSPLPGGAFVRFDNPTNDPILVKNGLSFISSTQACSNAETEIPDNDFALTRSIAENTWSDKLSPIQVSTEGVNTSLITNFYSGIYRTMINPQNYTGENPLWASGEPYFDSFYW